jgi:hypothetical protein
LKIVKNNQHATLIYTCGTHSRKMYCDVINGLTQKDVSDGEIDEEIVSGCPRSPRASAGDEEEEIAEDGDDDGHDVQGDPAPLVVGVQLVPGHRRVVTSGSLLKTY